MDIQFVINPRQEDVESIHQGLYAFNSPHFPNREIEKVACFARNSSGVLKGGLTGEIFTNTLFIQYLWVDENHRHAGLGSQLLNLAEKKMKAKGVTDIYLDTYSFQAPDFYLKQGFKEVGKYTGFPTQGVDKIFLQKRIC